MSESIPVLQPGDFKSSVGVTPSESETSTTWLNEEGRFHRANHYTCLVLNCRKSTFSIGTCNLEVRKNNLFLKSILIPYLKYGMQVQSYTNPVP